MKFSKYLLSTFALVASLGSAIAITPGSDFICVDGLIFEIPTTGPECELNRVITCTLGGYVIYDSFNGAVFKIPTDRKMRFPG